MTLVAICLVIPQRLKDNGDTTLTFWGHVTSSVTWPFVSRGVDFLWVVHSDHAPIWHSYGDMVVW